MIARDVNDPATVSSARAISVNLGTPDQRMLICSGIAIPEWSVHDDGTIYHETAVINLRQVVLAVEQATISVGLASIGNGNTNFQFALDETALEVDSTTQELLLTVDMALMGDPSALDRFGYQVVAVVTTQTTGISGTIRWSKSIFNAATLSVAQVAQLVEVSAGTSVYVPNPTGKGFGNTVYTPRAFGITGTLTSDANDFILPYEIPGAPYNVSMIVTVVVGPLFKSGYGNAARQTDGANPIVLTVSNPGVSGVDFRIGIIDVR